MPYLAWGWLAEIRSAQEDEYGWGVPTDPDNPEGPRSASPTLLTLQDRATRTAADGTRMVVPGSAYGPAPGEPVRELAYTVERVDEEPNESTHQRVGKVGDLLSDDMIDQIAQWQVERETRP